MASSPGRGLEVRGHCGDAFGEVIDPVDRYARLFLAGYLSERPGGGAAEAACHEPDVLRFHLGNLRQYLFPGAQAAVAEDRNHPVLPLEPVEDLMAPLERAEQAGAAAGVPCPVEQSPGRLAVDRKSTRLNSSHLVI